jgi:2-polyprenyl-6-methoxyphenol hydroxylase-like FAD-dependent oxidoreductase
MEQVVVIGAGIASWMTAAHLKQRLPQLRVIVIGPSDRVEPVVGESLTEFSTLFLRGLGLDSFLEECQYSKYGLTFHFKRNLDDRDDRAYVVDEAAAGPPLPSFLINRAAFDPELRALALRSGVEWIAAKVTDVTIGVRQHEVQWSTPDGATGRTQATWLVDASGRRRVLARKLGLGIEPASQRCCFWFRLRGFDRAYLTKAIPLKRRQHHFDSYFATQHFFGRGKWIWCIPITTGREAEEGYTISVGVTWRPDVVDLSVRDIDDFLRVMDIEHPLIGDLVRSGTVVDTNLYRNYMYDSSRMYDPSGWFIVGDAGWTVDPLYSSGLVLASVQAEQVAEMIARGNDLEPSLVRAFDECIQQFHSTVVHNVDQLYFRMHDPYQAYWTITHFVAVYFFFVLPMLLSRYHLHPLGARLITQLARFGESSTDSLHGLLEPAARRCQEISERTMPNQQYRVVNWRLWGPEPREVSKHLSRFLVVNAQMRLELLRKAGWPQMLHHLNMAAGDLLRAGALRTLFHDRSLLDSKLLARLFGAREVAAVEALREPVPLHSDVRELIGSRIGAVHAKAALGAAGAPSPKRRGARTQR